MLLSGGVPDLRADDSLVIERDYLGGIFEGDGRHDIGGHFLLTETVEDVCLARACVAYQQD